MYARIIPPFLAELATLGARARHGGFILDDDAADKTVAVFAHGGSLNVILAHLLRVPPFPVGSFSFALTGVASLVFTPHGGVAYPVLAIPAPHSLA
jgi:broad specificity phosphatase PhoE